jgi:hypothetical protein
VYLSEDNNIRVVVVVTDMFCLKYLQRENNDSKLYLEQTVI